MNLSIYYGKSELKFIFGKSDSELKFFFLSKNLKKKKPLIFLLNIYWKEILTLMEINKKKFRKKEKKAINKYNSRFIRSNLIYPALHIGNSS